MLGVEMASTGEVACFGVNKEEAFLKVSVIFHGECTRMHSVSYSNRHLWTTRLSVLRKKRECSSSVSLSPSLSLCFLLLYTFVPVSDVSVGHNVRDPSDQI